MLRAYPAATRRPDLFRDLRRAQEDMNRLFGGVRFAPRSEFPASTYGQARTGRSSRRKSQA